MTIEHFQCLSFLTSLKPMSHSDGQNNLLVSENWEIGRYPEP